MYSFRGSGLSQWPSALRHSPHSCTDAAAIWTRSLSSIERPITCTLTCAMFPSPCPSYASHKSCSLLTSFTRANQACHMPMEDLIFSLSLSRLRTPAASPTQPLRFPPVSPLDRPPHTSPMYILAHPHTVPLLGLVAVTHTAGTSFILWPGPAVSFSQRHIQLTCQIRYHYPAHTWICTTMPPSPALSATIDSLLVSQHSSSLCTLRLFSPWPSHLYTAISLVSPDLPSPPLPLHLLLSAAPPASANIEQLSPLSPSRRERSGKASVTAMASLPQPLHGSHFPFPSSALRLVYQYSISPAHFPLSASLALLAKV